MVKTWIAATALPLLLGCGIVSPSNGVHAFAGDTMGTTYTIKIASPKMPETRRAEIDKAVKEVLDRIDRSMSTWRPDSELSRFNASRETTPFRVSSDLIAVLDCARQVSEASQGAFDVTVGPLVDLWGFGANPAPERVPTDEEIAAAKAHVGYRKLEVDARAGTLRKAVPELRVDVAAIAPGYGSDQLAAALETLGYGNYMVELGGEVRTGGQKPDGSAWNIAVERPDEAGRQIYRAVPLRDESLSTSGDYRDYYEQDGVRYSHTIDPRTGRPIAHKLASVSVILRGCMEADAYATALDVLGPEEGYHLAEQRRMPVLFLVREAPGKFRELATPDFEARLDESKTVLDGDRQ